MLAACQVHHASPALPAQVDHDYNSVSCIHTRRAAQHAWHEHMCTPQHGLPRLPADQDLPGHWCSNSTHTAQDTPGTRAAPHGVLEQGQCSLGTHANLRLGEKAANTHAGDSSHRKAQQVWADCARGYGRGSLAVAYALPLACCQQLSMQPSCSPCSAIAALILHLPSQCPDLMRDAASKHHNPSPLCCVHG